MLLDSLPSSSKVRKCILQLVGGYFRTLRDMQSFWLYIAFHLVGEGGRVGFDRDRQDMLVGRFASSVDVRLSDEETNCPNGLSIVMSSVWQRTPASARQENRVVCTNRTGSPESCARVSCSRCPCQVFA
jgi:hypothetical protein